MALPLRSQFFLLFLAPLALFAPVNAGDQTGVVHTSVNQQVQSVLNVAHPTANQDTASLDLDGDGVFDLQFAAGCTFYGDWISGYNVAKMRYAGVEVAVAPTGTLAAKRLSMGDVIDENLQWRAFGASPGDSVVVACRAGGFAGPVTIGANDWWANGPVETLGYLGVRIVEDGGTRYGWVALDSYTQTNYAWLQISDMGIQGIPTAVEDLSAQDPITAQLLPNGNVMLQGPLEGVQRIMLHDASGRMVQQAGGHAPFAINISSEARGIYVLRVIGRADMRSFKLAW